MMRFTSYRWAGAVVTALGLFAATVVGQPPRPSTPIDPIDAAKAQQRIAEQKVESEILQTIENSDRLAKGNLTAKASQTLKTAKQNLQLAQGISETARTRLTNLLDAKLAAVEGRPFVANPNPGIKLDPKGKEAKAAQAEALAKYFAELKVVRDGIKQVEKAPTDGKTYEANVEIARLAKLYPHNPSVLALGQGGSFKNNIATAQGQYALMTDRWLASMNQVDKSAVPAIMDVEFPANWKDLSKRRLQTVDLTAKEKKIIEALDKPITVSFADRPLEEALQDLSNAIDQPLLIDKKSIEDLGLDFMKGVSIQGKGLSARTVLRGVLATQGLTFVVKDEAIQIVTVERARTMLTTRVYYLGDLVQGVGPFGGIQWGPFLNTQQTQANVTALIDMIKKIDPLSWSGPDSTGAGTITYHAASQSIIVRNSAEVHSALGKSFGTSK
jgi:hypothetical protein